MFQFRNKYSILMTGNRILFLVQASFSKQNPGNSYRINYGILNNKLLLLAHG
jgi:hypothetical protein